MNYSNEARDNSLETRTSDVDVQAETQRCPPLLGPGPDADPNGDDVVPDTERTPKPLARADAN